MGKGSQAIGAILKQGFKSILRQLFIVFIGMVIILIPLLLFFVWSVSPTNYIYEKTGFFCLAFPQRTYSYNAIDHGRDYDILSIFKLTKIDGDRLVAFLEEKGGWNAMPIDQNVMDSSACDVEFDKNMPDMLNTDNGYWFFSQDTRNLLCVYDNDQRILYIRKASRRF